MTFAALDCRLSVAARLALAACLLFCAVAGCGPSQNGKAASNGGEDEGLKKVSPSKLPKMGDYLPPLDDGKIEIAPTDGWKVMSREAKYVARFFKDDQLGMPRILVTVDASDFDD